MTGRGWLIIYGILLLTVLYLFISISGLRGDVNDLKADVSELQQGAAEVSTPEPSATPSAAAAPENDLSTAAGRDAQRKQDLAEIAEALTAYREAGGTFPPGLNELTPEYLDALPADPSAPRFNYRYRRNAEGFVLTSVLEQTGDPDDAKGDGKADKVFTITENYRG
ncbi:MAG: hypothetical protein WD926_01160 [Patescibacteria group bacterium]